MPRSPRGVRQACPPAHLLSSCRGSPDMGGGQELPSCAPQRWAIGTQPRGGPPVGEPPPPRAGPWGRLSCLLPQCPWLTLPAGSGFRTQTHLHTTESSRPSPAVRPVEARCPAPTGVCSGGSKTFRGEQPGATAMVVFLSEPFCPGRPVSPYSERSCHRSLIGCRIGGLPRSPSTGPHIPWASHLCPRRLPCTLELNLSSPPHLACPWPVPELPSLVCPSGGGGATLRFSKFCFAMRNQCILTTEPVWLNEV